MEREEMIQKYAERFPDSPVAAIASDPEKRIFDNRIEGKVCPNCGKAEVARVVRAGKQKGFCRKCFHECDLDEPGIQVQAICRFCQTGDHSNCDGDGCACDHGVKNVNLFEGNEKKRKIRHSFELDSPRLKELLERGKTGVEICEEMEISSQTLYEWKKKLGALSFPRGEKEKNPGTNRGTKKGFDLEKFRELYNRGLTDPSIARIMNVSHALPCYYRKRLGLAPNGRHKPEEEFNAEHKEELTTEVESVADREPIGEKNLSFYLDLAERFVLYLEVDYRPSFEKFAAQEKKRPDFEQGDLDRMLEICVRMKRIGVCGP